MFSKASTISALVAFFAVLDSSAALGINCRGSGLCPRASWDNAGVGSVIQGLRDAMYSSNVSASTNYNAGDHIICVSQSQKVTISAGASAGATSGGGAEGGATGNVGVTTSVGLTGSIGNGGICAFPQKTSMTLGDARTHIDNLLKHGCTTCGSDPVKNNDDSTGELTINYVSNPFCIGECLSAVATGEAAGGTNPTAGKTSKRDDEDVLDEPRLEPEEEVLEPRWGKRGERVRLE